MTNLYPFIQSLLEWPFSEFPYDVSLWNQYKYTTFNILSCRILIITEIYYEKTNELTIYSILCRNCTVIYRQKLASLFQVQTKLKACRNSKWNFSSSCFIAGDSHVKIIFGTCSSFQQTWYLTFSRKYPFIKILFCENISKLLLLV